MNRRPIALIVIGMIAALVMPALLAAVKADDAKHSGHVAVIGTGMMGGAMGTRLAELGYTVTFGSRNPDSEKVQTLLTTIEGNATATTQDAAAQDADIVVFAVPWSAAESVVKGAGDLDGKIIIDLMNPLIVRDFDDMEMVSTNTSVGESVQEWLPNAYVVKAFNAVGFHVVTDPSKAGGPVTIPIASNHPDAKATVMQIAEDFGFETFDVGPLSQSRALEALTHLYMVAYIEGRMEDRFEYYFRRTP